MAQKTASIVEMEAIRIFLATWEDSPKVLFVGAGGYLGCGFLFFSASSFSCHGQRRVESMDLKSTLALLPLLSV